MQIVGGFTGLSFGFTRNSLKPWQKLKFQLDIRIINSRNCKNTFTGRTV